MTLIKIAYILGLIGYEYGGISHETRGEKMTGETMLVAMENQGIEILEPGRLDQNPAAVYLAKLGKRTQRVQADALNVIADIISPGANYLAIPWHEIKYQHAQAIRVKLQERYTAGTVNRILSALRETVHQAWLLGQTTAENYLKVKEVRNVTENKAAAAAGRQVTSGEIKALIDVCIEDKSPAGYRDAAIICWMVTQGPRRFEVVGVDLSDYDPQTGQIKFTGKGNKERTNYIENGTADAFADWLQVRGSEPGPLFIPINKGGNMAMARMTPQAVYNMLNRRIDQAGIKDFSPHDLRRTAAGDMLDAGVDLVLVSKTLGHSDTKTTAGYDRRPEQAKKKAAQSLTVPYKRQLAN